MQNFFGGECISAEPIRYLRMIVIAHVQQQLMHPVDDDRIVSFQLFGHVQRKLFEGIVNFSGTLFC